MKKMLIVGITMSAAGTENSFLNFSRHIDFSEWEVDLLLAKREGDFLDLIPEQINVIDMGEDEADALLLTAVTELFHGMHGRGVKCRNTSHT